MKGEGVPRSWWKGGGRGAVWTTALALLLCHGAFAADVDTDAASWQAPAGIFCSCPPTLASGSRSVIAKVGEKSFVAGFLVRVEWRDLEPRPGQYEWSLLDDQLAAAQRYGKKVTLAVMNGPAAPSWLSAAGVTMFRYSFRGRSVDMPIPWDEFYLVRWKRFIEALGQRYQDHPAIALVHVTHSTFNGFEMQLPASPPDREQWWRLGFSTARLVDSWGTVVKAFARAFPRHALDVDVHPVAIAVEEHEDDVARAVVALGRRFAGKRFGVFAGWWSADNARRVYPAMYLLLRDSARESHAGLQMVASSARTPERVGGGAMESIELALASDIRYVEIWEDDLLDARQTRDWEALAGRLLRPAGKR